MESREEISRKEASVSEKLTYLLIGGGIGAILALLFAPKSGHELREDIADVTRKGIDKTRETAAQLQERAGEYYEVAKDRAGEYYETGRERASELYGTAEEQAKRLTEKAREAAAAPGNVLSAAIEAGKKAYFEEKRRTESSALSEGRPVYPIDDSIQDLSTDKDKES
jgi:gas vesicle protein